MTSFHISVFHSSHPDCKTSFQVLVNVNLLHTRLSCFVFFYVKGQFTQNTPKSKIHIFPFTFSSLYPAKLFWCESLSFIDVSPRDVCPLLNTMELDGTFLPPKDTFEKHNSNVSLLEIIARLLKIIHGPCCEQFYVETIFFVLAFIEKPAG